MSSTAEPARPADAGEPEWSAWVAIDWADRKHVWRLLPAGASEAEQGELDNRPEAVHAWATGLGARFSGRPVAVCLEQSRGALVYMLSQHPHLVLYPVHPTTAARYRRVFSPSGAKDDPRDADSLLDLLVHHRDQLRRWDPDTVETRWLQRLVEQRRLMVEEKTRQSNRLTACLKMYFPQMLDWFEDLSAPIVGALLERWPSLQQLQRAHPGTLKKFWLAHHSRSQQRIAERIQAIYQAVPVTHDVAVLSGEAAAARGLAALLKTLRENIAALDRQIEELVAAHPDAPLYSSLPGAGPVTVSRLIVAFGTRRERFDSAYQVQCYSGIAPVQEASGRQQWVHFRRCCPKFLRQTFQEFAFLSLRTSVWAQAFYRSRREKGQSHPAAVRALGYKWIRIIFRCWKDGKPYDEQSYLDVLQARRSPLRFEGTAFGWKTVGGFKKFSALSS